jgi:hypothetical protein
MKNQKSEANKQQAPTAVGSGDLLGCVAIVMRRIGEAVLVLIGKRTVQPAHLGLELLSNPKALESFAASRPWKQPNLCWLHALALADIRQDHPEWIQREENRKGLSARRILFGISRVFGVESSCVCCGGSQSKQPNEKS